MLWRQQDQFVCLTDPIETSEWGEGCEVCRCQHFLKLIWMIARSLSAQIVGTVENCISYWRAWREGEKRGLQVIDLGLGVWCPAARLLYVPPAASELHAPQQRTHPCSLHTTALRGASVSERTGRNPEMNMLTMDGIFVATGFVVALSLPLLCSPSSCPCPLLQWNHWRTDASCCSHFSRPHVDSMKTVTDQRLQWSRRSLQLRNVSDCPKLRCSWKIYVCEMQWHLKLIF